jgi:O-antigen biosynthesis protein
MESKWQKDYPSITDLSQVASDDNSSYNKMSQFIEGNQHVVDFGCATGYFSQLLTQKGCSVTGVEINPAAAKIAEQYCEKVIVADLDFISVAEILPSQTFDVAVFGDVLEHVRDPWKILEDVKQILKPSGCVIASIPNVAHGAVRLSLLQGRFEYEQYGLLDNTHLRFFTRETVEALFENAGYFIDAQDRTIVPVFSDSEFIPSVHRSQFNPELVCQIEQGEHSDTLQFIVRAFPSTLEGRFSALSQKYGDLFQQYKHLQIRQNKLNEALIASQEQAQKQEQYQEKVQQMQDAIEHHEVEKLRLKKQLHSLQSNLEWAQAQLKYSQSGLGELEAQVRFSAGRLKQAERLKKEHDHIRETLAETQGRLEAIQSSKFWKLRMSWFKLKERFGLVPDTDLFRGDQASKLDMLDRSQADKSTSGKTKAEKPKSIRKMFAFVSECPGDAYRYRCEHQAEMLRLLGYSVDVYPASEHPYNQLLQQYQVVVVHRVPHTHAFEEFILQAKQMGVYVVYDTDDLVFDASRLYLIDAYMGMDESNKKLYEDGVRRYSKSLSLCDYAVVSTEKLQQEITTNFPGTKVRISRNRISRDMEEAADKIRNVYLPSDGILRIGYFSGTKTHAKDFAECVTALRNILQDFSHVKLVIVGHLDIPEEMEPLSSQIEYVPPMPWKNLPLVYRQIDVNLAPLERNNDFTEAKSELKYFEAALLNVPTIASKLGAFQVAIQDGVNGKLCGNMSEWEQALRELIANPELRHNLGKAAFEDVGHHYLTRSAATETGNMWQQLIGGGLLTERPLSIAFVLRAPIAQTGGGYKKIFQLAHYLANQGHDVHLYVEPIAHLAGLSLDKIRLFCEENFGKSAATIHRGHGNILDSDVAIATNWPTAYVVEKLTNTRFKSYFIQDYEPHFYQSGDSCFSEAEATYDLPLEMISIGKHLSEVLSQRNGIRYPYVDFSLDTVFLSGFANLERHHSTDQCSILFFARPSIPRRNFQLGVKALEQLHQKIPNIIIKFYGTDEEMDLPFPYENLGILNQAETAETMRHSEIHLSFSMTNISTVIFEAMACGCATVEADVPSVRAMIVEESCLLVKPTAQDVCDGLMHLVTDVEKRQMIAKTGFNSVKSLTVENMCSQFESTLKQRCFRV